MDTIKNLLGEIMPIQKKPIFDWNLEKYHASKKWWSGSSHGVGHFNELLYQRIVEIKSIVYESV